jgi:type II secretory pathway component PulC
VNRSWFYDPSSLASAYFISSSFLPCRVAAATTSGHNSDMGRSFVLGLTAAVAGLSIASVSHAEQVGQERSTLLLRANGHTSSVEHVAGSPDPVVRVGTIARSALRAELARGIGRFLQNVKTEAVLSHGHFVGWRMLALFPKRPEVHVQGIKAGDVLIRVNGVSVERPEDFKGIWDTLDTAKELVLDIERNGEPSALHYAIVD